MEIRKSVKEHKEQITNTVKLILDLFDVNNINGNLGLNSCIACIFTFMKNSNVSQEDFEKVMDILKQEYSLDAEL